MYFPENKFSFLEFMCGCLFGSKQDFQKKNNVFRIEHDTVHIRKSLIF